MESATHKNLYLMRHAHALEARQDAPDRERKLTAIGVSTAMRMGNFMKNMGQFPDLILSSDAERAQETTRLVQEQFQLSENQVQYHDALYLASLRILLQVVNELDDAAERVMLVGHNPGLIYFAEYVCQANVEELSPGTVVHLRFRIDSWKEVSAGNAELEALHFPQEIY